jgi:1-aminocyclopropane-1-carboxylate deaminase/D-cysteine desulfhydrase-like pyridoxal-dependent ACC family enzyme
MKYDWHKPPQVYQSVSDETTKSAIRKAFFLGMVLACLCTWLGTRAYYVVQLEREQYRAELLAYDVKQSQAAADRALALLNESTEQNDSLRKHLHWSLQVIRDYEAVNKIRKESFRSLEKTTRGYEILLRMQEEVDAARSGHTLDRQLVESETR